MKNLLYILIFTLSVNYLYSQTDIPTSTPDSIRSSALESRNKLIQESSAAHIQSTNIGPTIFSGRVTDIDVNPNDPSIFYVAYATGGLWKTENNGTTFTSLFDYQPVMTIGDISVNWDNGIIWVGTGEVNSSRSSYAGNGLYKSTDWGKNWEYKGLPESHHIGRIITHPKNDNVIWVAVLGHLYSTNKERGVYKSIDGGSTWNKTLYINNNTGAVDLIIDPDDENILYATTWERSRRAWNFQESGEGSGIYKSIDAGNTWVKLNTPESGFPTGNGVGRIGLTIANKDGRSYVYAIVDNYNRRPKENNEENLDKIDKDLLRNISKDEFSKLENDKIEKYLRDNNFSEKHTAISIKSKIANEEIKPVHLVEYIENANALLFDTPVVGAEVYKSIDGGDNWDKTHTDYLDGVFSSYGYYFGMIAVNPSNHNQLYIMGVPILRSDDGGSQWHDAGGDNVHADHHALWINPNRSDHIINGNDGGINISYDAGENWIKCNSPSVGQFYYINVDNATPYNVYGGTQDNGVWVGKNNYKKNVRWHSYGEYPYKSIMGGDGMQIQIDNRDNNTVYTGFQFGNYFRINKEQNLRSYITPKHKLGERPYRWNWQSPIHLSVHNQDILYMGANKLLRSMNQGNDFIEISDDLTNGGKKGDVPYGTITAIHESPLEFGLIYTGSDDGKVHVTKNGGYEWININKGLPKKMWVSRIQASAHNKEKVYLTLNGYRWDDFTPYVYKSEDHGNTWIDISNGLPHEPINVIKEDPTLPGLIYVGTDHGVYISFEDGDHWENIMTDMPRTPIHDLVIHPTADDLLVGTHGRSIYKTDISLLRELKDIDRNEIKVFALNTVNHNSSQGNRSRIYSQPNIKKIDLNIYSPTTGDAILEVRTEDGKALLKKTVRLKKGLSTYEYDMAISIDNKKNLEKYINKEKSKNNKLKVEAADDGKIYLKHGKYIISIQLNEDKNTTELIIE